MEYNHSRKAGNQGDVWKHAVLVTLADSVAGKSDAFQYVESHCGSPVHELTRGGDWERGIGRLVDKGSCDCLYATIARSWLKRSLYPAGWLLVANRLAARFTRVRAVLADVAELVASHYPPSADVAVAPNVHVEFHLEDGYSVAASLERADLVFLDPPFYPDADADWRKLAETCLILAERDVPFVAWYPLLLAHEASVVGRYDALSSMGGRVGAVRSQTESKPEGLWDAWVFFDRVGPTT
jgi:23S rRNA (adenine2030-N6)-methyltransferase